MPRPTLVAGSLAALATTTVIAVGVLQSAPLSAVLAADDPADTGAGRVPAPAESAASGADQPEVLAADRGLAPLSRSAIRGATIQEKPTRLERLTEPKAVQAAVKGAEDELYATSNLNLWSTPGPRAEKLNLLDEGEKVAVTGRSFGEREEIVVGGRSRWVTAGYLDPEAPVADPVVEATEDSSDGSGSAESGDAAPSSGGACTNGTSVPSGVSPNISSVHQVVCAAWPEISTYGTFRSDGEHGQGLAVDIMVSGQTGYDVAEYLRANAGSLGIDYLIYSQRIWSVDRSGEGWRGMEDRGSTTANHYDHVHVTTY